MLMESGAKHTLQERHSLRGGPGAPTKTTGVIFGSFHRIRSLRPHGSSFPLAEVLILSGVSTLPLVKKLIGSLYEHASVCKKNVGITEGTTCSQTGRSIPACTTRSQIQH
ncbi:hypothetical protein QQF64_001877 [Cirrhinus molitorella]|uniref:Uncharacterized protein n=1 Tax=Cirrhinus molitorella TaxID=172907 RepID=A0ABR3MNJ7_9TELE